MPKTIMSTQTTLFRREDESYPETASKELARLRTAYPEYNKPELTWTLQMNAHPDDPTARVHISVVDKQAWSWEFSPGLILALIVLVALVVSGVTGWGW